MELGSRGGGAPAPSRPPALPQDGVGDPSRLSFTPGAGRIWNRRLEMSTAEGRKAGGGGWAAVAPQTQPRKVQAALPVTQRAGGSPGPRHVEIAPQK